MEEDQRFLVDVGMENLPFPILALSRAQAGGQPTVANISVSTRIMHEFEARWIDKFIQILHKHREKIQPRTLTDSMHDYLTELQATAVKIDLHYPFFVEKLTPVTKEKCLVRHLCTYTAKATSTQKSPNLTFKIEIPLITTYPVSGVEKPGGLFGQLSVVVVELASRKDIYPEDIVEVADRHALAPVYSFLAEADQHY